MMQWLPYVGFPALFVMVAVTRYFRVNERLPTGADALGWWRARPALPWFGINTAIVVCLALGLVFVQASRWRSAAIAESIPSSSLFRLACPCGFEAAISPDMAGTAIQCPECGKRGRVPAVPAATPKRRKPR